MNPEVEEFSRRRAPLSTMAVLVVVAAGIALANLASDVIVDFNWDKPAEHALGWPLTWYWRPHFAVPYTVPAVEFDRPHLSFWRNVQAPWKTNWPVSRYRLWPLAANAAMWLAMLAGAWAACRWLLARSWPVRLRPRLTTLVTVAIVTTLTFLANLSHDARPGIQEGSYGWPWIWYGYLDADYMSGRGRYWDYSVIRLAGNVAVGLVTIAMAGLACQWLLDRYHPRLRWSLRTMLTLVAVAAALCAWCVALRDRADRQDALLKSFASEMGVGFYFDRWGPQWLDLVGADRYRRRLVAAEVDISQSSDEFFEQLAGLRNVQLLDIGNSCVFTPRVADSLAEMRQLRVLIVDCSDHGKPAIHECLTAFGKLPDLERIHMTMSEEHVHELASLAGLANLKTLSLAIYADETQRAEEARTLAHLPPLPCLEAFSLDEWEIGDQEIGRLAGWPTLQSLDLAATSVTDVGLAKLLPLASLKELAISESIATAAAFESLAPLKNLSAVHIAGPTVRIEGIQDVLARRAELVFADGAHDGEFRPGTLMLDDGHELPILSGEREALERSLAALRRAHPGIVIDADYGGLLKRIDRLKPQWHNYRFIDSDMRRLLNRW